MRTEKKSLQMLHQPDQESSEQAQMQATKKCLLKIGDHIEKTITTEYKNDRNQADVWRRYVKLLSCCFHLFEYFTLKTIFIFFVLVISGLLYRNLLNLGLQNCLSCIKQRAGNAIYIRRKYKQ